MTRISGYAFWLSTALASLAVAQWQAPGPVAPAPGAPASSQECSTALSRPAGGLSWGESNYVGKRKEYAAANLRRWLRSVDPRFDGPSMPTIALATSGGGYRSMLTGAGVVQAMDAAESSEPTKGLYQALTYHAGLSGGAWLLTALQTNGPNVTISQIKRELWDTKLPKNSLWPTNTLMAPEKDAVVKDVAAKAAAGNIPTITDVWGRFLSFQLFKTGMSTRWSDVLTLNVGPVPTKPYPIMSALVKTGQLVGPQCDVSDDAPQWEFTPHESGSWDRSIAAFTPTRFLGSSAAKARRCNTDFDNLAYILGTSSSLFHDRCGLAPISAVALFLRPLLPRSPPASAGVAGVDPQRRVLYAPFPNPFFGSNNAPAVNKDKELYLLDGGMSNQNNPLWPLLQPSRGVEVILVNDNTADTIGNYPNGTELLHTYEQARRQGLARMPAIPSVGDFMSRGLYKRATFFGCRDPGKITLVYLPNARFTHESGVYTFKFLFSPQEAEAMIGNGRQVMTQGGDPAWTRCLACAIMHKKGPRVAAECDACLARYCA